MVKKLEKGSTVTCSKCHKEDHKSNKCPQLRKKLPDEKNKKKLTIKSSLIYTKPNQRNKSNSTSYVIKRRPMARWLLTRLGRRKVVGTAPFGCPTKSLPIRRGLKWCGFQRRLEAHEWLRGIWRLGIQEDELMQAKETKLTTWTFVGLVPHKVMVARF